MRRARDEQGFVLVTAIILLTVMLGLGIALVTYTNNQQTASAREQATEEAFNLAESALNAQIGRLSQEWPGNKFAVVPEECTSSASTSTYCPEPAVIEKAFPSTNDATCTGTEDWGSSLTNKWTTYIRQDLKEGTEEVEATYFNSNLEKVNPERWAYPKTEKLWVRAVGVVNCHAVAVVSLVSEQLQHVVFPEGTLTANWFKTSNSGKKIVINREYKGSQTGKFNIRCNGYKGTEKQIREACEKYDREHGQIKPALKETAAEEPLGGSSTTLSTEELTSLKSLAQAEGHFYSTGNCPTSIEQLSGKPTYIEGCGSLKLSGNGSANSEAKPGFLVLANGTIELSGTVKFYGIIYNANLQNSSEVIVTVQGNATVIGGVVVDGEGGVEVGSSHENIEYNPTASHEIESVTGAAGTRNSFRVLPASQ